MHLVNKLKRMVNAEDDCSNFHDLPDLGFQLGNLVLNLKPDDYMDRSEGSCSFSLMALDVPPPKGPVFIFGDPFLRRFVTIYDRTKPAVGFAVAKHDGAFDEAMASQLIAHIGGEPSPAQASSAAAGPAMSQGATSLHLDAGLMAGDTSDSGDAGSSGESSSASAGGSAEAPQPVEHVAAEPEQPAATMAASTQDSGF